MIFLIILFSSMIQSSEACAATSSTSTPAASNCRTCARNLITITQIRGGAHAFQSDVIDTSGTCAVRTFTCVGNLANIEINGGDGVIQDGSATATLAVTCNAAGTGWVFMGTVITQVECAST